MALVVKPDSVLARTALAHSRTHQPRVRRSGVFCRACGDSWPCDVRAVAESVLAAAGINPRAYDDGDQAVSPRPSPRPLPHRRVALATR